MLRCYSGTKLFCFFALCVAAPTVYAPSALAEDWLPVTAEELQLSSEPKAPRAAAIYLYRQVDRDDVMFTEKIYSRIKILTEEGRKYADIQIPYNRRNESISAIEARTIRPDGSIVEFDGTVFEKPILQGRGFKVLAKTFTLPDVQVGSIIEYRYRHDLPNGLVYDSHWILSDDLFTKHAKYSLNQSGYFGLRYSWPVGLPQGTSPPKTERGRIRLETRDVAAFVTEDYMPPENQMKYRVDFIYISSGENKATEPESFWKRYGKQRYKIIEDFVDRPRDMEQALAKIVDASDLPETKLRKIYARTQQLRNLSFERRKSGEEAERDAQKEAKDAGDVWQQGYGVGREITWLFLGLVRAAGIEAHPVLVSTRDRYFFDQRVMNSSQLNSTVILVKLAGKEFYLDPGTAFTPFGLLPWRETGVKGLRLDKSGGDWVMTTLPTPPESQIIRKANLRLLNGSLEGKVAVTYTGLEALWRRLEERNEDDADRKQFLENQIEYDIPTGIEVKLINTPDWNGSDSPLVAEYDVKVPGWASGAGQRALLPVALFSNREKHTFEHAARVHPLYFNFRYQTEDDVSIELPAGWQINGVPAAHNTDIRVATYGITVENNAQSLRIKRSLAINMLILEAKYYPQVQEFFQTVRTHDEQQVVIAPGKIPARR